MKKSFCTHQDYEKALKKLERMWGEREENEKFKRLLWQVNDYETALGRKKTRFSIPSLDETFRLYKKLDLKAPLFLEPVNLCDF